MSEAPLPPVELANRVGRLVGSDGSYASYETVGRQLRDVVLSALPPDWAWRGKRVLDFGCGAGRTLRHFIREAEEAEFWGCDIDAASIEWLNANLNPPLHGFVNDEQPPLPQPDDSYDLIYAFSVFTHITEEWSAWLLELHRLLTSDGLLIASFLGEGMSESVAGEPWVEDRIGMNVLKADQNWERGGPMVMLSPWWIKEHWGRAFEIVRLNAGASPNSHGIVVALPKTKAPSRDELERIEPGEPREMTALRHNICQLQRESAATRASFESSWSWRLTAPARRLRARVRR
jgi:SAM-dependent methyltransferase